MSKLIGLCGFSRVGKDTAAANMPGWRRFAFADALKRDIDPMLDLVGCDMRNSEHKERARPLMVEWGRTARAFKPDHWIVELFDVAGGVTDALDEGQSVVITDVRYLNEAERILAEGGKLVMIERPGYGPANDEEDSSIYEIRRECAAYYRNVPNDGTPEELGRKVLAACGEA